MKRLLWCLAGLPLSACQMQNQKIDPVTYKIEEDGAPIVQNLNTYESLGDRTFNKVQKYKITALAEEGRKFHFLALSAKEYLGTKLVNSVDATIVPIVDGSYIVECSHYYDIKITVSVDSVDNPSCRYNLLGVVEMTQPAKAINTAS